MDAAHLRQRAGENFRRRVVHIKFLAAMHTDPVPFALNVKQIPISSKTDIGPSSRPVGTRILPRDGYPPVLFRPKYTSDRVKTRYHGLSNVTARGLGENVKALLPYLR